MEDSLIDILCLGIVDNKLTSIEDAKVYVRTSLPKFVQDSDLLFVRGSADRIAVKLLLFSVGRTVPMDGTLAKLVSSVRLADKYKVPLVNLYHVGNVPKLVVRVPELAKEDTLSKRTLEGFFTFMHYVLGVKPENMSYHMDKELGTSFHLDAVHIKLLEELTASAASPAGVFPGEVIKYGEYKCTLPTILATLHFLSCKQGFLRKRISKKKTDVLVVSSVELRRIFNIRAGLAEKSSTYGAMLIKSALSVVSSSKNKIFPGGWISSNRSLNEVKSDTGLIYKLGYTERVPYNHKLDAIVFNDTSVNPKNERIIRDKSDDKLFKELTYTEFRTAVVLTAPRIDTTKADTFESQVKRDPLSVKSEKVLDNFVDARFYKINDSLNKAQAILSTMGKGNKKTKVIHYEIARNEVLHLSAHVPIKDGAGNSYTKLSDLPKPILDFCCKKYRYSLSKGKRPAEEISSANDMEVDDTAPLPNKDIMSEPPVAPPRIDRRGGRSPTILNLAPPRKGGPSKKR
jgi:hypothetical protein